MFLSKDRKIDSDKLAALVNEAYELVIKKIDISPQPSYL
jgi:predicted DNA-binding protein (MmcQ/YjbR family)